MDAKKTIEDIAVKARQAAGILAMSNGAKRNAVLLACAAAIRNAKATLQAENEKAIPSNFQHRRHCVIPCP